MDKKIIYINSMVIGILAVFATASGLFWKGLYKHDTVSGVAQMMGQDLITLIVVVPLLLVSMYLISRASLRGYLMWMGTIFYFLYSYASISFLTSYNQLFLVYVALFSVSLYTFLYGLFSMDIKTIKKSVSTGVTLKVAGVFPIIMGLLLAGMWLSMILGSLLNGTAPAALETYTTLVIQALDLGVLVPVAFIAGLMTLKGKGWGYALVSVLLVKVSLLGTAILSMIFFMARNGVDVEVGQALFFVVMTLAGVVITTAFYKKIHGSLRDFKDLELD